MNREEAPGKSPEDMYIQQKVRVLLMLKKMGSNVSTLSRLGSSEVCPSLRCTSGPFLDDTSATILWSPCDSEHV